MKKNVIVAGLLGGIVFFVWLTIAHGILPFKRSYILRTFPDQLEVHRLLKKNITEPGVYSVPYYSSPQEAAALSDQYRGEPVFEITYLGYTHDTMPGLLSLSVLALFVAPLLAAWLLSMATKPVLMSFSRRFLFVVLLGVIVVVYDNWLGQLLDEKLTGLAVFYGITNIVGWVLAGLVIAWRVKPAEAV